MTERRKKKSDTRKENEIRRNLRKRAKARVRKNGRKKELNGKRKQ